jgi:hypothetical protein
MMRERLLALRERRSLLVAQAAEQRAGAMKFVERLERATAWYERAKSVVLRLRAHPAWVAGGVALLVALRPRKAFKWLATAYSLWQGWRNLRTTLDRFSPAQPRRAYRAT